MSSEILDNHTQRCLLSQQPLTRTPLLKTEHQFSLDMKQLAVLIKCLALLKWGKLISFSQLITPKHQGGQQKPGEPNLPAITHMYLHTLRHTADTMVTQSAAFTSNVNEAFQTVTLTARLERYTCVIFRVARSVYFCTSGYRTHEPTVYTHTHTVLSHYLTQLKALYQRDWPSYHRPPQRWVPDLVTAFQ